MCCTSVDCTGVDVDGLIVTCVSVDRSCSDFDLDFG